MEENTASSQREIDAAKEALDIALQKVDFKDEFAALNEQIAAAEALDLNRYEQEGQNAFKAALKSACAMAANDQILQSQAIQSAANQLSLAMAALEARPMTDKSVLRKAIVQASGYQNDGTLAALPAAAKNQVVLALTQASSVYATYRASQEEIDAAVAALNIAMQTVEYKNAFQVLSHKIQEAVSIDLSQYEETGQAELAAAISSAKAICANTTLLQEEQIAEAADLLQTSIDALVKKPVLDTAMLEQLCALVQSSDLNRFQARGKLQLARERNAADSVLKTAVTQTEIDEAVDSLHSAWLALRLKTDQPMPD